MPDSDSALCTEPDPLLDVRDVRVAYGAKPILDIDHLRVSAARGVAAIVMGPNGAGKTTLLDVISGYAPTHRRARIVLRNETAVALSRLPRAERVRHGVVRSFQRPCRFPSLTVRGSLEVAAAFGFGASMRPRNDAAHRVAELLDVFRLEDLKNQSLADVPDDLLRRVEIARCIACQPRLLLLDEPTAGLDDLERQWLGKFLHLESRQMVSRWHARGLYAHQALTVVLVTHDLAFARAVAADHGDGPTTHILDQGRLVASGRLDEVLSSDLVREIYLGES